MPELLAALSPDATRFATCVPTPGTSIRVQVLSSTPTASLQSTLLHRRTEHSDALPRKIVWVHDAAVAVYCSDLIVVWDLNRGVVACTIPTKSAEYMFADVAVGGDAQQNNLYALVWSKESQKAQIHVYAPTTGKVQQKVKAGKGTNVLALALTGSDGNNAVVRQEDALRILNLTNGQKVAKYTSLKMASAQLVAAHNFVVTVDNGQALVIDATNGKRLTSVPLHHADDTLDLWATANNDDCILRVGGKLYNVSSNGNECSLQTEIASAPGVDQRVIVGQGRTLFALLQKGQQFQSCRVPIVRNDKDEEETLSSSRMTLDWTETTDGAKDKKKAAAKRKEAVLGPAQSGGQASGISDGPVTKKPRAEHSSEKLVHDDEDVSMDDQEDAAEGLDPIEDGDQGPSIADRLAKLHQALDAQAAQDEQEEAARMAEALARAPAADFSTKKATTQSLTALLQQALQSADEGMLELALRVREPKVLQETCRDLANTEHLLNLLNALTSRLASKPGRAVALQPWVSAVLETGQVRSIAHLQPLRNIIEERVAVFPALLKLEGRLGMMTN